MRKQFVKFGCMVFELRKQTYGTMRHVRLEMGELLHIFPSGTESMGDRGSKKAYTGPRTYLPTKFGCDRSIVVGCRSRNDRQTDKQNGMTIRLTLCERDATDKQTNKHAHHNTSHPSQGEVLNVRNRCVLPVKVGDLLVLLLIATLLQNVIETATKRRFYRRVRYW